VEIPQQKVKGGSRSSPTYFQPTKSSFLRAHIPLTPITVSDPNFNILSGNKLVSKVVKPVKSVHLTSDKNVKGHTSGRKVIFINFSNFHLKIYSISRGFFICFFF